MEEGVDGLLRDKTRPPGRKPLSPARVATIVRLTQTPPAGEATHWTLRAMAKAAGVAASTVRTICRRNRFSSVDRSAFVQGARHRRPVRTAGACCRSTGRSQALDRTPGLPLKKGRGATMTHDYKRHGTTTLFAALDVLEGTVISQHSARHRHEEFVRFLDRIERTVAAGTPIHAILDNYSAHKHKAVRAWLEKHPRWTFHFTPTSCSWLNAVEGFFAKLTRRRLKHGVFRSVAELRDAIQHSTSTTGQRQSPSSGSQTPTTSSPREIEGSKRWIQSTSASSSTAVGRRGRLTPGTKGNRYVAVPIGVQRARRTTLHQRFRIGPRQRHCPRAAPPVPSSGLSATVLICSTAEAISNLSLRLPISSGRVSPTAPNIRLTQG